MIKMLWLYSLFVLFLVSHSGADHESFEMLSICSSTPNVLQSLSHTGLSVSVSVSHLDLNGVSSNVLMAESWLRAHVLVHYPATKITTIVVGNNVLCNNLDQEPYYSGLVLPSLKNLYHSLIRWGLEKEIKLSASFSSSCLHPYYSVMYRDDIAERVIKPILSFIQTSNSTYSVNPSPIFTHEISGLVTSHVQSMKKLGFLTPLQLTVLNTTCGSETTSRNVRRLSFVSSKFVDPYPARPIPLPEISPSSIGFSVPPAAARKPPPQTSFTLPPLTSSFPPQIPPHTDPANAPHSFTWPPCTPTSHRSSAPTLAPVYDGGETTELWCVAKPSVPAETLAEALDYACGKGNADCSEIKPHGSCYMPDTLVAHASYAFNSYWQKTKRMGGTCSFGGTAMIINADPSFQHCRFVLN